MFKRCWYLILCFFVFTNCLDFEARFALERQKFAFFQTSTSKNKNSSTTNSYVGNNRRKQKLNAKRCIYKNNPYCLNNSSNDLIRMMLPEKKFKQVEEIIDDKSFEKPNGCTREYRFLRLSNSLKVFMVYDKSAKVSFGNMHLDFGFASDPENIPGLSRYLLYTLLFGSLKKRFSKHFALLIKKFKGGFGANISRDCSRYSFNIHSSEFEMALKIFANMFINLNTNDDIHEEILATLMKDLIYHLNMDSFRLSDVLQEVALQTSTVKNNYDWNILEYMQIHKLDKLKSKKLIFEFFNQYYRADRMTLTILSNKTLDEQTSIVRKYFNKIRRGDSNIVTRLRLPDSGVNHPLYGSTGKVLAFDSPQHSSFIKLLFPLNNIINPKFSSKPMFFFSMYISSKRKGSLYYYLYKRELVTDMKVYLSNSIFSYYSLIIDIYLQRLGELNITHIIQGVFSVFEMMRNNKPKLELYNQAKTLKMNKFKHQSNGIIFNECSNIQDAFYLLKCPPEKVLSARSIYTEYNLELHYKILSNLKPENMLLITTFKSKHRLSLSELFKCNTGNTTEIMQNLNNSTITPNLEANVSSCVFTEKKLPLNNNQSFYCTDCINNQEHLKNLEYNVLFEKSLNESNIITSNFTRTKYIVDNIHPSLISYLVDSINPFTALNKFEIYDPDYKFFRVKDTEDYLVGIQEQEVPTRIIDAIQNLESKKFNKMLNEDYLKDYQQIFYLPMHSINVPKSSISITINLPPNLYSDELSFPYSPKKLEAIFSLITLMLLRSFEDIKYYYKKLSTNLNFLINTPTIYSYYTYGLIVELSGITDHLPHAISTIASRIKDFPMTVKDSDLNFAKSYFLDHFEGNIDQSPLIQFQSILKILLYNQDLTFSSVNHELKDIKLHEITYAIDFLVKYGTFEGIVYGNINPIKARELLLLFFINLGRTSLKEKASPVKSNIFLKAILSIKNFIYSFLNSIRLLIRQFIGKSIIQGELPEHLKSKPTQIVTQNTLRELQVIDLLSLKEGSNFFYFEKSNFEFLQMNTLILKICYGYFTTQVESLIDILVEMIQKKYQSEPNSENNETMFSFKKSIFSDGLVSIEIKVVSRKTLSELIPFIMKLYDEWIVNSSEITIENFISTKKQVIESLSNNMNYNSMFDFKREIYLKRYQFNRKKDQIEFISQLNYSDFLMWLTAQPPKVIKLLFVIYSPYTNKEEVNQAYDSIPPEFKMVNSADYFFKQENTRSFNPTQIYNLT